MAMQMYYRNKWLFIMMLPGILWFALFHYLPMYGVIIAFKDYRAISGILGSEWVGLEHFQRLFGDPYFFKILWNTVYLSFLKLLWVFPAPIILALLLNEIRFDKFKRTVQTISYMPYFLSWVIVSGLVLEALSPSTGIVNNVIRFFGGDPIFFVTEVHWFRAVLVSSELWKTMGYSSIIYLASIAGIDPQLYESAVIDGAGRFKRAIYITLPSLIPVISILLILSISSLFNAGFDQIINLYNPQVYDVADIIDTYVFRTGLAGAQYSYATAVGVFKSVAAFILLVSANMLVKLLDKDYAIW